MKALAYTREDLPNGGYRLIFENGGIFNVPIPFPTGEHGDRIRRNATKTAYKIARRIVADKQRELEAAQASSAEAVA